MLLAAALALGAAAPAPAQTVTSPSTALSPEQEAAVRTLIGEHLRAHPEIVIEALQAWQSRQVTEQEIPPPRPPPALAADQHILHHRLVALATTPSGQRCHRTLQASA